MGQKGLVIVYTGGGKGKTSAALGLVLRAVGYNHKVCMVQFCLLYTSDAADE